MRNLPIIDVGDRQTGRTTRLLAWLTEDQDEEDRVILGPYEKWRATMISHLSQMRLNGELPPHMTPPNWRSNRSIVNERFLERFVFTRPELLHPKAVGRDLVIGIDMVESIERLPDVYNHRVGYVVITGRLDLAVAAEVERRRRHLAEGGAL